MEILKGGNKNSVECYDCGSLLGFQPSDVHLERRGPEGPYEFDGYNIYTAECPVCDSKVNVSAKITHSIGEKSCKCRKGGVMTRDTNEMPILAGDWGASHWELYAADNLPDGAICTAVGCVAIANLTNQTVAMTRNTRSGQAWEMPSGHTEAGEQPWDTLCRETSEEAGFIVSSARLFAYRKITRPADVNPALLSERQKNYPNPSHLPYYYAFTAQERVPFSGEEIAETSDFTVAELQRMATEDLVQWDELMIIHLGLQAAQHTHRS